MTTTWAGVLFGVLLWIEPAWADGLPRLTLYVDCGAAPGGTGAWGSPYDTIGGAIAAGRPLAATRRVAVSVKGTCDGETLPIPLDYPVDLSGQRIAKFDSDGFPVDGQYRDTLVTLPAAPTSPPLFFLITGDDVRIARISVDGKVPRPPDGNLGPPSFVPAFEAIGADGLYLEQVRVVSTHASLRTAATSGLVVGSYLSGASAAILAFGGPAEDPATVWVVNSRLDYRTEGIGAAGGISTTLYPGSPGGHALEVVMVRNDLVTTYTHTGPTNPNAVRLGPHITVPDGSLKVTMLLNRVSGPAKYTLVFSGGQPVRGTTDYTGSLEALVLGTTFDAAAQAGTAVITFTGIRATALPCELDPSIPRFPDCPLANNRWEYLEGAFYEIRHGGELDTALIDHPEIEPVDGRVLDNLLIINDEIVDNQTFVVIP